MKHKKKYLVTAAILGGAAVIAGAFGTHTLGEKLDAHQMEIFETAVRYQMYHVIAVFITILLSEKTQHTFYRYAVISFIWGIIIFSGSLYALSTSLLWAGEYIKWLGAITPLGGLFLIGGWALLCIAIIKSYK